MVSSLMKSSSATTIFMTWILLAPLLTNDTDVIGCLPVQSQRLIGP